MYVQTKGRARSKDALYILFSSELDRPKISTQIAQYRQAHDEIKDYLKDRVLERSEPRIDEINEHFQDEIEPYVNANGAVLLASGALSLLHRYCQQLPSDAFGIVLPWFKLLDKEDVKKRTANWSRKEIVSVTLPLNTALRETIYVRYTATIRFSHSYKFTLRLLLQSNPMSCSKWAKISAAFNTCIKLHAIGELNERFLPTSITERVAEIANVHFEHWKKYGDDGE